MEIFKLNQIGVALKTFSLRSIKYFLLTPEIPIAFAPQSWAFHFHAQLKTSL